MRALRVLSLLALALPAFAEDRPPGLGPRPGARRGCDWARGWRGAPTPRVGSAGDGSGQPLDVRPVCGEKAGHRPVAGLKQPVYTRVWTLF